MIKFTGITRRTTSIVLTMVMITSLAVLPNESMLTAFANEETEAEAASVGYSVCEESPDATKIGRQKDPERSRSDGEDEIDILTGSRIENLGENDQITAALDYDNGTLTFTGECGANEEYSFYFYGDESKYVKSVIFGGNIEALPDSGFGNCENLTMIELPKGLTTIGDYAFRGCSSLKSISLPNTLTKLGAYAFSESGLEKITVPGSVKVVESGCFQYSGNLQEAVFEEGVEVVSEDAFSGCPIESITFPDSIREIPSFDGTQYRTKLEESTDSDFVISPEGILFGYRGEAENVVIPANAKKLAGSVFSWKKNIKSVEIGDNIDYIPNRTFFCCHGLESVNMSDKITHIGDYAFYNILNLKDIRLPSSLKTIGDYAFYTSGIENVNIPDTLERIGFMAFEETPFMNKIEGDYICFGDILYRYRGSDKAPVVPDNIKHIGMSSFASMPITSVTLPQGLLTIDQYAFCSCTDLHVVVVPNSVVKIEDNALGYDSDSFGVDKYNDFYLVGGENSEAERYASDNGISFTSTTKPSGKCGDNAFWEVDLPNKCLTISGTGDTYSAYDGCDIGYFSYRAFIETIKVEEGITGLGNEAFYSFTNAKTIILPDSLRNVGQNAFYDLCVKEINFPSDIEEIGYHNCFGAAYYYKGIYDRLENINVAEGNGRYFSRQGFLYDRGKKQLVCVPNGTAQTEINIPEGIVSISGSALNDAENIERFVFPETFDVAISSLNVSNNKHFIITFTGDSDGYDIFDFDSFIPKNADIYCHFSKSGWNEITDYYAAGSSEKNIVFHDLDNISDKITLSVSSDEIVPFEAVKIELIAEKLYEQDYVWSSSDPEVAIVSDSGAVMGLSQGSTVISAESIDGSRTAEITIQVKGSNALKPGIKRRLNSDYLDNMSSASSELVFSERFGGYFILTNNILYFYSVGSDTYTEIRRFDNIVLSNVVGSKLTVCEKDSSANNRIVCIDLDTLRTSAKFEVEGKAMQLYAVSSDNNGKIYVSLCDRSMTSALKYCLKVFSISGEELSCADTGYAVVDILGFPQNGEKILYVDHNKESTSFFSAGHLQNLQIGSISGGALVPNEYEYGWSEGFVFLVNGIEVMSDNGMTLVKNGAVIYGDKYVVINCAARNAVIIEDLTDRPTDFSERNDLVYEDSVFAENGMLSADSWTDPISGLYSRGTRSVYREKTGSVIIYKAEKQLVEYSLADGSPLACCELEHFVYSLDSFGDDLIAVEKENGEYFVETLSWDTAKNAEITPESIQMNSGQTQKIKVSYDSEIVPLKVNWSTSDPKIATVSKDGDLYAWNEGNVTVTFSIGEFSVSCDITVFPKEKLPDSVISPEGADYAHNAYDQSYGRWSDIVNSYLFENDTGYTRIQYVPEHYNYKGYWDEMTGMYIDESELIDKRIIREEYDKNFNLLSSTSIEPELPLFGGAFGGEKYNFIVFGQENENEDDSFEVLRVVKYSKDWQRIDSASLCGKNTYIPFAGGSLRMDEEHGVLFIATCHEMYANEGVHHQASMTFRLDEETLEVKNEQYEVSNLSEGYVSHSFNQFIKVENGIVYRADHGDALPRGVVVTTGTVDSINLTGAEIVKEATVSDNYYNYTGITISDFDVDPNRIACTGSTVNIADENDSQMNVYVTFTDKNTLKKYTEVLLSDYTRNDNVFFSDPYLTQIEDRHYIAMWQETTTDENPNSYSVIKCVTLDDSGNISEVKTLAHAYLSDCEPFINSEGNLVWYSCENDKVVFYSIDPLNFEGVKEIYGDVDGDGKISAKDSMLIQRYVINLKKFSNNQLLSADVNGDGKVTNKDALDILRYTINMSKNNKIGNSIIA